jgi:hypothetical protein
MSDTETDLSSNSEEENDGGYSREESFVKDLFTVYFLSEANSSGIKSCRNGMDASANEVKIQIYNTFQIGVNKILLDSILHHASLDETTISILKDEAMRDVEIMSKTVSDDVEAVDIRLTQSTAHDELPAEQMQSAIASISSDGDASTISGSSSEVLASNNVGGHRREREPSESDNPRPQQRRKGNKDASTSLVRAQTGSKETKRRGEIIEYVEEEVKQRVRNDMEKIKEKYESLNHGTEVNIGIGSDSLLLQMAACTLMKKICSGKDLLESISAVMGHLMRVCEGTYTSRCRLFSNLRDEATALENLPTFDSRDSMGSLLTSLDKNKSINESRVLSNVSQMTGVSDAVRHVDSSEKNMTTELLKAYSTHDQSYKNFLLILANVWTGIKVLSLWRMDQIFNLLIEQFALSEKAKAFYRLKCNCELDESMSVLDFLEEVLLPLSNIQEYEVEVVKLLLVIKDILTNSGNIRVKKELQSMRKQMILDKFSLAQSMDINGNVVSGGEDHLGNGSSAFDGRRRDPANAVFNLLMGRKIERKLPSQLLVSRGGFALGILRLSCSDMTRICNRFTSEFLFGTSKEDKQTADAFRHVYGADDGALKGLKAVILKEKFNKNDTSFQGEKKIIIFTAAQMKSLEELGEFTFAQ